MVKYQLSQLLPPRSMAISVLPGLSSSTYRPYVHLHIPLFRFVPKVFLLPFPFPKLSLPYSHSIQAPYPCFPLHCHRQTLMCPNLCLSQPIFQVLNFFTTFFSFMITGNHGLSYLLLSLVIFFCCSRIQ